MIDFLKTLILDFQDEILQDLPRFTGVPRPGQDSYPRRGGNHLDWGQALRQVHTPVSDHAAAPRQRSRASKFPLPELL